MSRPYAHLDQFIQRIHRRLVALRILEATGLGMLMACAAGLLVVPVLLYRGEPANSLILTLLSIGALCGLIWGAYRRPSRLAAAVEADRQLQWADLLATGFCLRYHGGDAAFSSAVLALAEQKCQAVSPSRIILNRLGARAWGGIGLATALLITLGLISANPLESQASPDSPLAPRRPLSARLVPRNQSPGAAESAIQPAAALPHDRGDQDDHPLDPHQNQQTASADPARSHSDHSVANPNGAGAGAGRTSRSDPGHAAIPDATSAQRNNNGSATSGGVGQSTDTTGHTGSSGASAVQAAHQRNAPPWQSADWPTARDDALRAVRTGQVPPAYQDLVREYFTR